jgi:hypothetical protein
LTFRRRAGTRDLTYSVQVSTNLAAWVGGPMNPQTTETLVQPLGDGMEQVTVQTLYPVSGYSSHFLRLTVIVDP